MNGWIILWMNRWMEETHKSINTDCIVPTAEGLGGGYMYIVATFGRFFQCFFYTTQEAIFLGG